MKPVFADTFFWIAFTLPREAAASAPQGRATIRMILTEPSVRVVPQSHESFLPGLDLFVTRSDKGYSFIDCISMETMRREGLIEVLTNDRHFEQEGFRALFRL